MTREEEDQLWEWYFKIEQEEYDKMQYRIREEYYE